MIRQKIEFLTAKTEFYTKYYTFGSFYFVGNHFPLHWHWKDPSVFRQRAFFIQGLSMHSFTSTHPPFSGLLTGTYRAYCIILTFEIHKLWIITETNRTRPVSKVTVTVVWPFCIETFCVLLTRICFTLINILKISIEIKSNNCGMNFSRKL